MSVGTGRQNYNSVLEITVSFLGKHKWEPYIYFGFSPALYLQCGVYETAGLDHVIGPIPGHVIGPITGHLIGPIFLAMSSVLFLAMSSDP